MFRRAEIICVSSLCAVVVCGGCRSSMDDAAVEEMPAAVAAAASANDSASPDIELPPTTAGEQVEATQALAAKEFAPPFPDRVELFEPPKRAQSTVRRDDESGDTVELKGFVNVDGPRVVLSIDGVIAPIAEGDEKYGVQVISIDPPSVVLQRGRSRWTATLQ